jgi:hypothetical protein
MLIEENPGPSNIGSMCWRLPLVQKFICERFEVSCNISYIAQPLKHLGSRYLKAACALDHWMEEKGQGWYTTSRPRIFTVVKKEGMLLPYFPLFEVLNHSIRQA